MKRDFQNDKGDWNIAYATPGMLTQAELLNTMIAKPKILVIDDDPMFRATVEKIAKQRDLLVTTCASIRELSAMAVSHLFDVVIVDYFLDDMKNNLKGTEVASVLEGMPIILISNTTQACDDNNPWPRSVRKFVSKKSGINTILDAAIRLREGAHA